MSRSTKAQHRQQVDATRKKSIFEFFDGVKQRKVDVWNFLIEIQTKMPPEALQMNSISGDGIKNLVAIIRTLLNVPTWSEENEAGLTDGELLEVFKGIMAATDDVKKMAG